MELTVNGENTDYDGEATLAGLVASMDADPERVATMLNDEIVKQEGRAAAALSEGDRVEILSFAGGG
ncbi:MAG: sulfur carrier protein ThiS [Kiritimatiellae bacterium]|nr:sulfur carrier protein ThiS [Kiritimatiellia bacterium]